MSDYLNLSMISELREIMEDDFSVLYETFIADSEQKLQQLEQAFSLNDSESIRRLAHSLKGSCCNVGANKLADLCEVLENAARDNDSIADIPFLNNLLICFKATQQQIQQELLN